MAFANDDEAPAPEPGEAPYDDEYLSGGYPPPPPDCLPRDGVPKGVPTALPMAAPIPPPCVDPPRWFAPSCIDTLSDDDGDDQDGLRLEAPRPGLHGLFGFETACPPTFMPPLPPPWDPRGSVRVLPGVLPGDAESAPVKPRKCQGGESFEP